MKKNKILVFAAILAFGGCAKKQDIKTANSSTTENSLTNAASRSSMNELRIVSNHPVFGVNLDMMDDTSWSGTLTLNDSVYAAESVNFTLESQEDTSFQYAQINTSLEVSITDANGVTTDYEWANISLSNDK